MSTVEELFDGLAHDRAPEAILPFVALVPDALEFGDLGPRSLRCGYLAAGFTAAVVLRDCSDSEACRDSIFNIPSLYLGEAEQPGGGEDPLLLSLPAILNGKRTSPRPQAGVALQTAPQIDEMLRAAGLMPERWQVRARFSFDAYGDWLKIPVNTEGMFAGLPADAWAALIDEAFSKVDPNSWRREKWTGWTAWKPEESCRSHQRAGPFRS